MDMEKLNESTKIDNGKLEELMRQFKESPSDETAQDLKEELKESQLFLPVIPSENMFEGIENAKEGDVLELKGPSGFDINYPTNNLGQKAVPLFTSDEAMEEANLRSSSMVMFVEDLVNMLQGVEEKYAIVTINPMTETSINMPILTFLNLFKEADEKEKEFLETLEVILDILKKHSISLEENMMLFVRGEDNFMKEQAVDGVFVPNIPFNASTRQDFLKEFPYLNVLLMDEGKKIVYIGSITEEDHYDTIIAPGTEFKIEKEVDEFTTIWKCGKQPFYEKE